jgi:hypothetical protein
MTGSLAIDYAKRIKNRLVTNEWRLRRIRWGVCSGCYIPLNLRTHFRWPFGLYETEIRAWVRAFVRPGAICYDIGAAEGYYAVCCAKLSSPNGQVIAFEPDPVAFSLLQQAVGANAGLSPIQTVNSYVGAVPNQQTTIVTIDSLVFEQGFPSPDFLKVDVEGGELDVLRGGERVFSSRSPQAIIEVHSLELEQQCQEWLRRHDYEVTVVSQRRFLPEYRPGAHNRWLCATPRGSQG